MSVRAAGERSRRTTTASLGAAVVVAALLVVPHAALATDQGQSHAQGQARAQATANGAVVTDTDGDRRLLIGWTAAADAAQRATVLAAADLEVAHHVTDRVDAVAVPAHRVADLRQRLAASPAVTAVEADRWIHAAAEAPSDTLFPQQWALHNTGEPVGDLPATAGIDVRALDAWDVTRGSDDVVVAVIDSGVDATHPDLADALWTNPGEADDGEDDDDNGYVDDLHGWNFAGDPADESNKTFVSAAEDWHGTAVAGVIAARADDAIGIAGLAPQVRIMVLKTFTGEAAVGQARMSDMLEAIAYATANGADVINASWVHPAGSELLRNALAGAGVPVVAAAGNDGADLGDGTSSVYPAGYQLSNLVTVTSLRPDGGLAGFSNVGRTEVEVAAPGIGIYTTYPGAEWRSVNGTSFSAPLVSAALALARATHPDAATSELVDAVSWTSRAVAGAADTTISGGMLDAAALLHGIQRPICDAAGDDTALFRDVDPVNPHADSLRCLRATEVANGDADGRYLPAATITRAQLATLLVGALEVAGVALPADPPDAFGDDDGTTHEPAIDALAALGIAAGNEARQFQPNQAVTRAQLAALMVRSFHAATDTTTGPSRNWFLDDDRSTHADAIDVARDLGLVRGVATLQFAPEESSRRDQVASLVARLLDAVARHGGAAPTDQ